MKLGGAFSNGVFQSKSLIFRCDIKTPHLEQVANPQERLGLTNRFNQEIGCSGVECAGFGLFTAIAAQCDDWQKILGRVSTQRVQHTKSVDFRHDQIEKNEVGIETGAGLDDQSGVGHAHYPGVTVSSEQLLQ